VALVEVVLFATAISGGVESVVVAVLHFAEEEIARVYLAVHTDFRVRHQLSPINYKGAYFIDKELTKSFIISLSEVNLS
jgi:hypothetical protein